jgi:hypothetical protein
MMLAVCPVPNPAVAELTGILRHNGAGNLADRLDRAAADQVKFLALTVPERAVLLAALDDPPDTLSELAPCSSAITAGHWPKDSSRAK